jgi:TolB-like protein/Tfp pilus assembly protein PilF
MRSCVLMAERIRNVTCGVIMIGAMGSRSATFEPGKDVEAKAALHLDRILASRAFRQADRMKRFLAFIVGETVAGRGAQLKEFVVGIEVFGRDNSFDPRNDPIVRVQARRLRAQLARYYREEGLEDDLMIELPKGGYSPAFRLMKSCAPKRSPAPSLVSRNAVLALPFVDNSPAGDQSYFCNGVNQEIIQALTGMESVRLVARNPEGEPDGELSSGEAADRHNAAIVVTGNVRVVGRQARITANLIDAVGGCYLWSGSIDRRLEDIFAVQEEIARVVSDQVRIHMAHGPANPRARRPTENLAAYNLYLQGRYHLNQRTEEGLRKAVEFFEKAIVEDAEYAQSYSGLADAYSLLGHYGVLPPAEVWTKAASNAAWAVLKDEHSAEAHTSLAHVKGTQDWDWLGAESEFQRAIGIDPRYPTAHHWYAVACLAPQGKLDEAREEVLRAQTLDPISSIIARDVARIHYYSQDYDAALEQCDHAIELNPHFPPAYWMLGRIQEQRGDLEESAAAFQRALQLSPQGPLVQAALGRTLALSGKRKEAARILHELLNLRGRRYVSPFEIGLLHFALDEVEEGFGWVEKAFQDRSYELITIRVDPRLESLKGDPRLYSLIRRMGLP